MSSARLVFRPIKLTHNRTYITTFCITPSYIKGKILSFKTEINFKIFITISNKKSSKTDKRKDT